MTTKIAVAIIHGVGDQNSKFADPMIRELENRFARHMRNRHDEPKTQLVCEPVHWAPVLQASEDRLWRRVNSKRNLDWTRLRKFMISFAGDAIAYQPTAKYRNVYDDVHEKVAESLSRLARKVGPKAPLCLIAHSLGTVIASNYFYDLAAPAQKKLVPSKVKSLKGNTPLENGHTLTHFFTLGSPLAIWTLRFDDFGTPINVPSPKLAKLYPPTMYPKLKGRWINYFDDDDVIAYPLRPINKAYRKAVHADMKVNVGSILSSWTPASHTKYWTDDDVTKPIAKSLADLWIAVNP